MKWERLALAVALVFAVLSAVSLAAFWRTRRDLRALEAKHLALREESAALARKPPSPPPSPDPALTREARLQLENEIRELRRLLQDRDRQLAALQAAANAQPTPEADPGREGRGRRRWEEMVAQFRENNPERAAEFDALRANFREQVKTAVNDQVAFLEEVDVTAWEPEDQEIHRKLIDNIRELSNAFLGDTPPNFANAEARQNLFARMRETGELLEQERALLLRDTARQMGYDEAGADEFVQYIETINRVTSPRGFLPRMGGFGNGGRREREATP